MTPRLLLMMLVLAAVWGASFLFMRVAVPALGPVVLADARVAIAGAALVVVALAGAGGVAALARRGCATGWCSARSARRCRSRCWRPPSSRSTRRSPRCSTRWRRCAARWSAAVWLGERVQRRRAARAGARRRRRRAGGRALAGATFTLAFAAAVLACLGRRVPLRRRREHDPRPLRGRAAAGAGDRPAARGHRSCCCRSIPLSPVRSAPDAVDLACLLGLALLSTSLAYLLYFRLIAELGADRRDDRDLRRARVRRAVGRAVPRRGGPPVDRGRRRGDPAQRLADHAAPGRRPRARVGRARARRLR